MRLSFVALSLGALASGCHGGQAPGESPTPSAPVDVRPVAAAEAGSPREDRPRPALPPRLELGSVDRYTFGIAVDATHVYWVDYHGGGGVFRARKDGGGREQLAGEQPFARDVAVDDRFVYWVVASGPPGAVLRVAKTGGSPETFAADQWNAERIFTHRGRVLWTAGPPVAFLSAPANGGAPSVVVPYHAPVATMRGADVFFVDATSTLRGFSITGSTPADAPAVAKLGRVPSDLAADADSVYVADAGEPVMPPPPRCAKPPCPSATTAPRMPHGAIVRVALADGKTSTLIGDLDHAGHVAVDDRFVYFSSRAGVQRIPKRGGPVESLSSTEATSRMLVDDDRLIFQEGQKIVSLARGAPSP